MLIDQQEPLRQRLAVLGHHSMADGVAAAGYAALFIDGDDAHLRQLDRYLTPDRYGAPQVTPREFHTGAKTFTKTWPNAARAQRIPRLTTGARRAAWTVEIPTRWAISSELPQRSGLRSSSTPGASTHPDSTAQYITHPRSTYGRRP